MKLEFPKPIQLVLLACSLVLFGFGVEAGQGLVGYGLTILACIFGVAAISIRGNQI